MDKHATCKRTYQRFDLINVFTFSRAISVPVFWYGMIDFHPIYKTGTLAQLTRKTPQFPRFATFECQVKMDEKPVRFAENYIRRFPGDPVNKLCVKGFSNSGPDQYRLVP